MKFHQSVAAVALFGIAACANSEPVSASSGGEQEAHTEAAAAEAKGRPEVRYYLLSDQ